MELQPEWNEFPRLLKHHGVRFVLVGVGERGPDGALRQGQWNARPVDVREAADGTLYVSDDLGGRVFKITYGK